MEKNITITQRPFCAIQPYIYIIYIYIYVYIYIYIMCVCVIWNIVKRVLTNGSVGTVTTRGASLMYSSMVVRKDCGGWNKVSDQLTSK